jgi:hypothetical protein
MGHILVPPSGDCWYLLLLMGNMALVRMNQDIQYTVQVHVLENTNCSK